MNSLTKNFYHLSFERFERAPPNVKYYTCSKIVLSVENPSIFDDDVDYVPYRAPFRPVYPCRLHKWCDSCTRCVRFVSRRRSLALHNNPVPATPLQTFPQPLQTFPQPLQTFPSPLQTFPPVAEPMVIAEPVGKFAEPVVFEEETDVSSDDSLRNGRMFRGW